jgi:vitamin B12 transporter
MLYWTEQENVDFLTNHNLSDISSFQIGLGFSTSRFFRERNFVNSWGQNYASLGFLHEISNDTKLYGNLRFSDYSDFESSETYNFKVSKSLTSDLSIFAKFSTGFTPPEALDLYSYGVGYPGNPDLSAEESRNYELGFSKNDQASRNELKMTLFFTEYNNLILAPYGVVPENVRKSESIGIELWSHNQITQRVHLESSVSYAKSKNLDSNEDFLPKRPEFFGSVTATYSEDEFDVGTQMNFKNRTRESATRKNDDYFLVRLFGNYHISDQLTFNARIENLFDENYEEVIDYPALGRAAHAGLTYNF